MAVFCTSFISCLSLCVAQVLSEWLWDGSSCYWYHFCFHIPHALDFYYNVFIFQNLLSFSLDHIKTAKDIRKPFMRDCQLHSICPSVIITVVFVIIIIIIIIVILLLRFFLLFLTELCYCLHLFMLSVSLYLRCFTGIVRVLLLSDCFTHRDEDGLSSDLLGNDHFTFFFFWYIYIFISVH